MQKLALFLIEHVLLKVSSQLIPIYIYIYTHEGYKIWRSFTADVKCSSMKVSQDFEVVHSKCKKLFQSNYFKLNFQLRT